MYPDNHHLTTEGALRLKPFSASVFTHLKSLTNLQPLYLTSTKTTDARLVHLKGLINLQSLS